jgi:hypothetical protein
VCCSRTGLIDSLSLSACGRSVSGHHTSIAARNDRNANNAATTIGRRLETVAAAADTLATDENARLTEVADNIAVRTPTRYALLHGNMLLSDKRQPH